MLIAIRMGSYSSEVAALLLVRDFLRRHKMYHEADTLRQVFAEMNLSLCDDRNGSSIVMPTPQPIKPQPARPLRERDNARSRNKLHRRQRRRDVKSRGRDFAEWVLNVFADVIQGPCDIIDVAGGKGDVTYQLATNTSSHVSCTVIDPVAFRLSNAKTKAIIKSAHDASQPVTSSTHTFDSSKYDASQYHPLLWKFALQLNDVRVLWLDWYGVLFPKDVAEEEYVFHQVQSALHTLTALRISHLRDYFTSTSLPQHIVVTSAARLLVALHPDEATEEAVDAALVARIPFAVVPCCVFPSHFPNRVISFTTDSGEIVDVQVRLLEQFLDYLQIKHSNMRRATIDSMLGPNNIVLYMLSTDYD